MTLSAIVQEASASGTDPDDYIEKIWEATLTIRERIQLSLELFDMQPTYHVLTSMWFEYEMAYDGSETSLNELIYSKYQSVLSAGDEDPDGGMQYSLFFDIFQSPEIQIEAWNYFLRNNPSVDFLKIMLSNAAPIPYNTKDKLYQELIKNVDFHVPVYKSIRDSCTYLQFYSVELDKRKAMETILRLDIEKQLPLLDQEPGRQTYKQIIRFLSLNSDG